jgi:glycosyltransferase involved in cell wall biosynthesis
MLSIIVPVGDLSRDKTNLEKILFNAKPEYNFDIILVFDFDFNSKAEEFRNLLSTRNIRVIKSDARNPNGARHAGFLACKGDWVIFCDSDDEVNLELLANASPYFLEKSSLHVFSFKIEAEYTHRKKSVGRSASTLNLLKEPGLWRCVISKEILNEVTFVGGLLGEDLILLTEAILRSQRLVYHDECVYYYKEHTSFRLSNIRESNRYLINLELFTKCLVKSVESINRNSLLASGIFLSFVISSLASSTSTFENKANLIVLREIKGNYKFLVNCLLVLPVVLFLKLKRRFE